MNELLTDVHHPPSTTDHSEHIESTCCLYCSNAVCVKFRVAWTWIDDFSLTFLNWLITWRDTTIQLTLDQHPGSVEE